MDTLGHFIDRYERRESNPALRQAKRLRMMLETETSELIMEGDKSKPVAVFVYNHENPVIMTLSADDPLSAFVDLIMDEQIEFYNISYVTGNPTVFRPEREPLLGNQIIVTRIDRQHGTALIVERYRPEQDTYEPDQEGHTQAPF